MVVEKSDQTTFSFYSEGWHETHAPVQQEKPDGGKMHLEVHAVWCTVGKASADSDEKAWQA